MKVININRSIDPILVSPTWMNRLGAKTHTPAQVLAAQATLQPERVKIRQPVIEYWVDVEVPYSRRGFDRRMNPVTGETSCLIEEKRQTLGVPEYYVDGMLVDPARLQFRDGST